MILFDLKEQDVWLTSDTHYNHANICLSTTKWNLDEINKEHAGVRNFESLEKMNKTIVNGINNYVKPNDILIHLGDWSFGGKESIYDFRKQILCKNIYLCLGNHDYHIQKNEPIIINDDLISIFPSNLFKLVTQVFEFKVKFNKKSKAKQFFASHYSHRIWNKSHHGVYHVFGHSHGSLDNYEWGRSMDIGIDSAFKILGEYRPFHIKEIYDILSKRDAKIIDHHNDKTT